MATKKATRWPVLTRYDQAHLGRIALPLGGIGTGTISLGGRGDLRDWEVVNRPAIGFKPRQAFFAIHAKAAGGAALTRALEGALDPRDYDGGFGTAVPNHSLPRFRNCAFETAYPFGQVALSDPAMPVSVRIQGFNPLIPADVARSSMPVAVLRFVVANKTARKVTVSICGNLENFIGQDGNVVVNTRINESAGTGARNTNNFRIGSDDALRGIVMRSNGIEPDCEQWGTFALTTTAPNVTHRTSWADLNWGDSLLDYWDDFSQDGRLEPREASVDNPIASLAAEVSIPAHGTREITFILAWHFPNRPGWGLRNEPSLTYGTGLRDTVDSIGNHYTTQYADAWDAAERAAAQLRTLEQDTRAFVNAFTGSDLPAAVKEAALFNVSTLRSQTTFRIASGQLMAWEGCGDKAGCCWGSCTHVWNYENTLPFLFGDLARTMREVEFLHATRKDGLMAFRADLALNRATEWVHAAADGQMGCLMKLYREWQLSGDDAMLRALWPNARKALEFCWRPGGWDADEDGVMEGCQHNTMDVEYFGPNPEMGTWYLGALRAMEEMARHLAADDPAQGVFADKCRRLFENGRDWMDAHLFNGEYYEHEIRPPRPNDLILDGLRVGMGAENLQEPVLQLGAGCLTDQLVGQYMAHVCGLGYILDPKHVRATLKAIMKYNFKTGFMGHFNHLRSYVLGDESALLIASYPRGQRPKRPFPYFNEAWTGLEYTAAAHMLYEGQQANGVKVYGAVRARYDGMKRNPFDEQECGHHYARAMAAWTGVLALTGFHFSAVTRTMRFAARPGRHFWSNGTAWGLCVQRAGARGMSLTLSVLGGQVSLDRIGLTGQGDSILDARAELKAGDALTVRLPG